MAILLNLVTRQLHRPRSKVLEQLAQPQLDLCVHVLDPVKLVDHHIFQSVRFSLLCFLFLRFRTSVRRHCHVLWRSQTAEAYSNVGLPS